MEIEAIEPHGLCSGVNAAIAKALGLRNVYCLHELVHNEIIIDELKRLGYRFVKRIEDVPDGAAVVFSAHGVAPSVREYAVAHGMKVVDTTCPFVARAHKAVRNFVKRGLKVAVIGDTNHVEVIGILGEVPNGQLLEVNKGKRQGGVRARVGVVAQTTMNADDVTRQVEKLRKVYDVESVAEVCFATKERQDAVREFCVRAADGVRFAVLVLGSQKSANSRRLAEVARQCGANVFMAGTMDELRAIDFSGVERMGVTSGASTPERFFNEAMRFLRNTPNHVAIIMDGSGRWAMQRGKRRGEGHAAGARMLVDVLKWCGARGIRYLTVYAFSTESWKRPRAEVDGLMKLFARMLKASEREFFKNRVRFRMIGRRGDLSPKLLGLVEGLEARTAHFERELIVAISYGGRAEIVDAVNVAIEKGERLTEETLRSYLYAPDVPDPDLVIRTGGESSTSNFLLWESAHSEYYFTDTLWPDFSEKELDTALESYAMRHGAF